MEYIGENEQLIDIVSNSYNLISAGLNRINIQNDDKYELTIELYFELCYSKVNNLMLRFSQINEYSFYHHNSHYFYNIENYKLLKVENMFYISLDPYYGEIDIVSSKDQDFILSGRVEGFA